MANLKALKTQNWIALILLAIPFVPLWVSDTLVDWLQNVIPYRQMLSILGIIVLIELTFILLYYNYSKSLETNANNKPKTLQISKLSSKIYSLTNDEKQIMLRFL